MKHNRLPIFYCTVIAGLGLSPILRGASDALLEKPAATASPPANPFGPKPTEPADATGSPDRSAMDSQPLNANQFAAVLRAMLLERFDKNKDGNLAAAELAEAQALFTDGRGRQTGARAGGGVAGGPLFGLRPMIMRNFGKAGNQTLTNEELAKLRVFLFGAEKEPAQPAANDGNLRRDLLQQFDKNHDGKLDDAEIAAAKASLVKIFSDLGKNSVEPPARAIAPPAGTAKTP